VDSARFGVEHLFSPRLISLVAGVSLRPVMTGDHTLDRKKVDNVAKMTLQLKRLLEQLQSSYWVIPSVMALLGMLLVPAQYLIHELFPESLSQLGFFQHLQKMSVSTARGILATVAGAAIGTASVVFSVSIVVLSLTASQFGPRLLKNFLRQGVAQLTLGTFIATFMFSLFGFTLLDSSMNDVNLVYLLVSVAIFLGAGSFFVLIFYIHHIATFIQAPRVIDDVSRALIARLKALPELGSQQPNVDLSRPYNDEKSSPAPQRDLRTSRSGYVQAIDFDTLLLRSVDTDLQLELTIYPGQFVLVKQTIATVRHTGQIDSAVLESLLDTIDIGTERSSTQDLGFALDQLVEIAVRALSPGINDPFTAINCIDQLAAGLSLLADRELPPARIYDDEGRLRISKPYMRYCDVLNAAYEQIRQHGKRDQTVTRHLLVKLLKLHDLPLPDDYRDAVREQILLSYQSFDDNGQNHNLLSQHDQKRLAAMLNSEDTARQ